MGFGLWLGDLRGRRRGEEVSLAISRRHTIIPARKRRLNIIRRIYDIASLQTLQHIPPQAPRHRDIDPWHIWDFSFSGRAKLLLFLAVALNPRLLYRLRSRARNWIVEIESLDGWESHVSRVSLGSRVYRSISASSRSERSIRSVDTIARLSRQHRGKSHRRRLQYLVTAKSQRRCEVAALNAEYLVCYGLLRER